LSLMSSYFKDGACPKLSKWENLDITRLSGDWYLHADTSPMSRVVRLDCNHVVLRVADYSYESNVDIEMNIEGNEFQINGIKADFTGNSVSINMFGEKVNLVMNLLDTDYENLAIFHQCFENIKVVRGHNTLKPVHVELVVLASRNANISDADYNTLIKRALTILQDETVDDFNRLRSGDAA
jgi:hypothetical protein